jgi:exopolyphosphatase / guanosine-5'-triphosphate,3'-diphosphate pyrophosphatase
MKRASIDLGTNTCLLLIGEWDPLKKQLSSVIGDHSTIVRLGEGVDQNRMLQPQAIERTIECLKNYLEQVRVQGITPESVICVGTSQARDAKNSHEFFSRIKNETGFQFRVLSGDEEARATFLGALLPGMNPATSWVIDIGGGSTELISVSQGQSLDVGSVRFTERFLRSDPVTDDEFWSCQEAIDQEIEKFSDWKKASEGISNFVAVAGTATTLAAWNLGLKQFDSGLVDQCTLSRGDVHRMVEELKWRTLEERRQLPGIEPKRADVLLAGALILWRSLELLGFTECHISSRGLRYGVLNTFA